MRFSSICNMVSGAAPLPGRSSQTLALGFDGTVGTGTFARSTGAIVPDTGLWANENQILNSATFVTQNVTTIATAYTLSFKGTGTITIGGTGSGTLAGTGANDRVSLTFTPTAGTCSFTLSGGAGSVTEAQLQRGSVVGTYLATTSAARYDSPRYSSTAKQGQSLLVEESSTQLLAYSNKFDASPWTASNVTPVQNLTDVFGNANTAWTVTATNANGTLLQAVTSASATRDFSVYIKRITGTGNVDFTVDNGSTWTTKTLTTSWQRLDITQAAVTNPTAGIRIVTSGDAIGIAYAQLESLPYPTSIILNTASSGTVSRGAESVSYATAGVVAAPATIEGWFNFEGVSAGKTQTLWSSYTGAADYTSIKWNGVIVYAEKAKTGQTTEYVTITPGSAITANTWHHVALTINADGTMGLYLDGVADLKTSGADADGLGAEIVAGGDMSTPTDWTYSSPWNLSTNVAVATAANGSNLVNDNTIVAYKLYKTAFDLVATINGVSFVTGTIWNTTGTGKTEVGFSQSTPLQFVNRGGAFTGSVDNASCKEVYNTSSTAFVPVIASTMQVGSYNSTLQANGLLENWRFFNKVLTASEIATYYNKGR